MSVEPASDAMSTDQDHVDPEETERGTDTEGQEPERNPTPMAGSQLGIAPAQSPDPAAPPTDESAVLHHLRYPLNSRRLTAAHLRAIAEAIGLPTGGSVDQLRQCIEGKLQTEREDPNVVVIIKEIQTTEQIIALADAEGEFVRTPPLRRGHAPDESVTEELQEVHTQLQEAEGIIDSAREKDAEQV